MRCEEKSGFLMLHQCGNVAETVCSYCGKKLCNEHTFALTVEQFAALAKPPLGKAVACLACFRQHRVEQPGQQPQQDQQQNQGLGQSRQRSYDDDPYYRYPYYGGYYPYGWGDDYSHRDRHVFNSSNNTTDSDTSQEPDVLDS